MTVALDSDYLEKGFLPSYLANLVKVSIYASDLLHIGEELELGVPNK